MSTSRLAVACCAGILAATWLAGGCSSSSGPSSSSGCPAGAFCDGGSDSPPDASSGGSSGASSSGGSSSGGSSSSGSSSGSSGSSSGSSGSSSGISDAAEEPGDAAGDSAADAFTCTALSSVPGNDVLSYVPVVGQPGACSGAQISAFVAACMNGDTTACATWFVDPSNSVCAACVNPLNDAGTYAGTGATMYDANGNSFPNLPGCLALADGNTSCAAPLEQFLTCAYFACDSCLPDPTDFSNCIIKTETLACAGYYAQLGPCAPDYADGGTETAVCGNSDLYTVTNVICGTGPAGPGD